MSPPTHSPIVHQYVGLPYSMRRYPKILYAAILRRIPSQIHVVPFLGRGEREEQFKFYSLIKARREVCRRLFCCLIEMTRRGLMFSLPRMPKFSFFSSRDFNPEREATRREECRISLFNFSSTINLSEIAVGTRRGELIKN